MLCLLSHMVIGGNTEDHSPNGEGHECPYSLDLSSLTRDTDEEFVRGPMPIINIDQTELAQEGLDEEKGDFLTSSEQTDSCEDAKDNSAFKKKNTEGTVPVVIPSRDICRRIVELIEYYLSDANLVKNMFLLKHVTKHREGFVSLKLLTSYKKVKRLTKDWRVVAHSLKSSNTLELNGDETKVRRKSPLPPELEEDTRPFRTLLATHISQGCSSMNQLAEYFGKFGEIISLQVHKPGGRTLNEVRQADRHHYGISQTICAIIEFEKVHCAQQGLRSIANNAEEYKMKVMEFPRKKTESLLSIKAKPDAESAYYSNSDLSELPSPIYCGRVPISKWKTPSFSVASSPSVSPVPKRRHVKVISSPESSPPSPCHYCSGPPTPCSSPEECQPARTFPSHGKFAVLQRYEVPRSLPLPRRKLLHLNPESKTDLPCQRSRNHQGFNMDSTLMPLSPWLKRRSLAKRTDNGSPASTPSSSPSLQRRLVSPILVLDNVKRFPRGPDGTRGFTMRRSLLIQAKT